MTFEEFCSQVGEMILRCDRPCVTASVEATYRASEIVNTWQSVDAIALFGNKAVERTDYEMGMDGNNALLAGVIALMLPDMTDFARQDEPNDTDPLPLCIPWAMGTWFVMAIRDPHLALDGRNIILHGDPNGID